MTEQQAVISNKSPISAIWLLPVIAALIGLWLLFKSFSDAGIEITIKTTSAEGIVAGKTEVRFKGFPIGVVTDLDLTENLNDVMVTVELKNNTRRFLSENTLFWLVKPEISLSGVSGLDTVLTGNYFEMLPETGSQYVQEFEALTQPPPIAEDSPGLHVTLHAKELGSITHGSSVFYKQIKVGEVYGYDFSEDKSHIKIKLFIEEDYASLVKLNTRFWNASGIEMKGDLSGFKVKTQSLASIIGGGIAFYSPDIGDMTTKVEDFTEYPLFEGFDEARAGVVVLMDFPKNSGIKAGITKVIFEGVEVGLIEDFVYNQAKGGVTATVLFDPRLEPYLLSNMDFWLVKPSISLSGIANVDRLLSGTYVAFRLGDGEPIRHFDVLPAAPPLKYSEPGLHLNISADSINSLSFGAPVFYKNLKVGSIQNHILAEDQRSFNVHLFIEPEYMHLVNSSSVFYEQGGFEFSGTLRSFTVRSSPIEAIISGGVSFHTIDFDNGKTVANGHNFPLNNNLEHALNTETITLQVPNNYEFVEGITKINFGEKHIGTVKQISPSDDLQSMVLTIGYKADFKNLFKQTTKIWVVEPTLTSGNIAGFNALLGGSFFQVKPGTGAVKDDFTMLTKAPPNDADDPGLQLTLIADSGFGLVRTTPITYKKMVIGEIDALNYSKNGYSVEVSISIEDRFRHLVGLGSSFFVGSGFDVKANMQGMQVTTQSLESIVRGGIALFNDKADLTKPADEMDEYTLYANMSELLSSGREIQLRFEEVIAIKADAQVQYNGHVVGRVAKVELEQDLSATTLTVLINEDYPDLVRQSAKYWFVQPETSVAKVSNSIAYFIGNFISVLPGSGEMQTNFTGFIHEPALTSLPGGLNLTLTAADRGSINPGNPVYYRLIKVGRVLGVELNENANGVNVYINIYADKQHLVNNTTKFYNASGIKVDAGLFSGVQVDTESLETILAGGIAFATPVPTTAENLVETRVFPLYDGIDEDLKQLQPTLKKP
ncbi:PqiB family protein [Thalassotalea sp. ND16A]|uniref:PqiB family protein n=1 Tax=Thalassotalea sp. ND16A TaxID=1535422 RepID=UPI00051A225A|nr:MlaD family protein [Thalassotalea sp. ND16A]KGJ96032.1 hypothetical protein ND16A_1091 [Thalassotalea sp. ND16A]